MASQFFRLANSPNVMTWDGLRGIRVTEGEFTLDGVPYLEFVYDGNTSIQVGFESDDQMNLYLDSLDKDYTEAHIFDPENLMKKTKPTLSFQTFND